MYKNSIINAFKTASRTDAVGGVAKGAEEAARPGRHFHDGRTFRVV